MSSIEQSAKIRISLFLPFVAGRGGNRVMVLLANGFAEAGFAVDLVVAEKKGDFLGLVSRSVQIVDLGSKRGVLRSLPALARYLRRVQPDVMLTAMDYINVLTLLVARLIGAKTRLFVSCHNSLLDTSNASKRLRDRILPWLVTWTYGLAEGIVVVSQAGAADYRRILGRHAKKVVTIYNPVVDAGFAARAGQTIDHLWFREGQHPVIVAVGALVPQKGYVTLIDALAILRQRVPARLVILGEGEQRELLEQRVADTGLQDAVALLGHVSNPLPFMARAGVFVLSSNFEGFGLVLAEALACGTPAVSTNCRFGPAEILDHGKYGRLVPVGDANALADALQASLSQPHDSEELKSRGSEFSVDGAVANYLRLFGFDPAGPVAKSETQVAVIQLGARLHYAVPEVLARSRMLAALYTDAHQGCWSVRPFAWLPRRLRPRGLRRLLSRVIPASIPRDKVKAWAWPSLQIEWYQRAFPQLRKKAQFWFDRGLAGHWLARRAIGANFHQANALYVHPCSSTAAVVEAKKRGMQVVLEAISHPGNKFVEAAEYQKFGLLSPEPEAELHENLNFFKREALLADMVLAASPFVREGLIELGIEAERVEVVPYGLDAKFVIETPTPQTGRVLYVGNVGYLKGVPYLAEATRMLRDQGFQGEVRAVGPADPRLVSRPEFAGPRYVGQVPRDEVGREFLCADLFVFPTLSDGFGIVLLEAMAAGLPVICTANCADLVRHGHNGFLVPPRDPQAIADAITLIVSDRVLRERMSKAAKETAAAHDLSAYERRLVQTVQQVGERKSVVVSTSSVNFPLVTNKPSGVNVS